MHFIFPIFYWDVYENYKYVKEKFDLKIILKEYLELSKIMIVWMTK